MYGILSGMQLLICCLTIVLTISKKALMINHFFVAMEVLLRNLLFSTISLLILLGGGSLIVSEHCIGSLAFWSKGGLRLTHSLAMHSSLVYQIRLWRITFCRRCKSSSRTSSMCIANQSNLRPWSPSLM